ncbi:MAG: hypothetical protein N2043_01855 [Ignavibacterium sp.]|nr:hypothetical protein [Ignavibacterium sp.]
MRNIPLKNNQIALFKETKQIKNKHTVYIYYVPCPLCKNQQNEAISYDQQTFITYQVVCRNCGVYFRPVPDPTQIEVDKIKQPDFDF